MKVTTFDFDTSVPRPDWREGQFDHLTPVDIKGQSADVCWQADAVFLGPEVQAALEDVDDRDDDLRRLGLFPPKKKRSRPLDE